MGIFNTRHGLNLVFGFWEPPMFGVYQSVLGIICLINVAWWIRVAYIGRIPGIRDENMTVGDDDSQPEWDEVTPLGGYKDDDTATQ
jgi:hypothetical protein